MHDHTHRGHPRHAPTRLGKAFGIGVGLNLAFVVVEVGYGVGAHSLALIADAGHNLGDVLGLLLAWGATHLARQSPTPRRTYGFGRSTILSSLANAVLLMLGVGGIAWEAVRRLFDAQPVAGMTVVWVAACGIAINAITALFFFADRGHDLNIRSVFTHMAADAAVSLGVVVSGLLMAAMHWWWLDPAVSLAIAALLTAGTWGLLRESMSLAMDGVPAAIDPVDVERYLASQPLVEAVHDLHIWAMSTTETALTAHLVMHEVPQSDGLLARMSSELHERFGIEHATIQFEYGDGAEPCAQTLHANVSRP